MRLEAGAQLGPYVVIDAAGAGGMGEVYRARDTRLDRMVALKVLPAALAETPDVRARFEREARAASSLNHPHICTLYDIGQADGIAYLVMEFLEGESLAERLKRGPLAAEALFKTAIEIADALDQAHRRNIVHRDLKPGNVMLTPVGAKLLDFGLARPITGHPHGDGEHTTSPDSAALTGTGVVLGTLHYMAPEQLEGKEADARSDLFAFGAMLYEMATGQRAFAGQSPASVIVAIMSQEPRPLPRSTPPALERMITRCLAKDPEERWQNARDVMHELQWIAGEKGPAAASDPTPPSSVARGPQAGRWPMIATGAALAGALAASMFLRGVAHREAATGAPVYLSLTVPTEGPNSQPFSVAVSPQATRLAFIVNGVGGRTELWTRDLHAPEARRLAGTEGAGMPFWSADGRSIAFFADGKLKRVEADGGPSLALADAPDAWGGAWGADGTILYSPNDFQPLYRVTASGGQSSQVTKLGPREEGHRWPTFLPDGRHFVFLADATLTQDHQLSIGSLDEPLHHALLQAVTSVQFVAPRTLLYVRGGELLAHPFDPAGLRFAGKPIRLASDIAINGPNHQREFSGAADVLVYRSLSPLRQLAWFDRQGQQLGLLGKPQDYGDIQLSPDGRKVAYAELDGDGRTASLWLLDLASGLTTQLTESGSAGDFSPVWSPQGDRIAFGSYRGHSGDLYVVEVARAGTVTPLLESEGQKAPLAWSPDGNRLVFSRQVGDQKPRICVLTLSDPTSQRVLTTEEFGEFDGSISPDGRWLALSHAIPTAPTAVAILPFPAGGSPQFTSSPGGFNPFWGAGGRSLVFQAVDGALLEVSLSPADSNLKTGPERRLFAPPGGRLEGLSPEADRFLIALPMEQPDSAPLTVVLNWSARTLGL